MRKLASIKQVSAVSPIEGADRIEVTHIDGWNVITGKGEFKPGDKVIYFEIDSYLPVDERFEFLRARCYREFSKNGKIFEQGFRIKTMKLRGVISQGLIMSPKAFPEIGEYEVGDDLTEKLGVRHYDEISAPFIPVKVPCGDKFSDFPFWIPKTDEERIQNLVEYFDDPAMLDKHFEITEKNDGCVRGDTHIITDAGNMCINHIVTHKLPVSVLSYNEQTGTCEYKPIVAWHRYEAKKPMTRVAVSKNESDKLNCRTKGIYCTTDHLFYTENGWVEAGKLKVGDVVYQVRPSISRVAQQMLAGCLLGDSSVMHNSVHFNHCEGQYEYLMAKARILGDLWLDSKDATSGYGSCIKRGHTVANAQVREVVESDISRFFTPICIAFWYMDDGTLNTGFRNERPTMVFCTQRYSDEKVDEFINLFNTRFGVKATKIKCTHTGRWEIRISNESAEMLFGLIAPYIVPSMKYKLPEEYRNVPYVLDDFPKAKGDSLVRYHVISNTPYVEKYIDENGKKIPGRHSYVFDLEVADNHNYFANGTLIHNSSCTAFYAPSKTDGEENWFGVCSRNMRLKRNPETSKFWSTILKMGIEEKLKKYYDASHIELALQGELVGPGIQANRDLYPDFEWHVFRIWDITHQKFLEPTKRRELCKLLDIPHVAVIDPDCRAFVKFRTCEEMLKFAEGKTVRGNEREGVVFKEINTDNPITFKSVSNSYLLKQG